MTGQVNRGRDLAGWLAAAMVAALLLAGAAAAALRAPPGATGEGQVEAVALDLSVGVVPLAAVVPAEPPEMVMSAPPAMTAPQTEDAPDVAEPVVVSPPRLPQPVMDLPQADAPPMMTGAPPPPALDPSLDMAESPRPKARPELQSEQTPEREMAREVESKGRTPPQDARPEEQQARPALTDAAPQTAPRQTAPPQTGGSEQAARPAEERRVAGGQDAARYSDRVMRQIAKLRRQKAPERGVVTVGFEIGGDGGLRRVAVVSSSGSVALDKVAMDHIRRAAPFPPPPEGVAVRFAFEFVGR